MNHFRKVAEICKNVPKPEEAPDNGEPQDYEAGIAQGQYDLAQQILKELNLASATLTKQGGAF